VTAALGTAGWIPAGIDVNEPCAARVHDAHLGGLHNFAADRWVAQREQENMPDLPRILRAERAFLGRAVRFLAGAGVRQFLDLGCGLPTAGSVHQIVEGGQPGCPVVYVDVDPVAVAHGARMLAGHPNAAMVRADLRDVPLVLAAPAVRELIDFSQPVGILMVAVLQHLSDRDDPTGTVAHYRDTVSAGSYLVVSHTANATAVPPGHPVGDGTSAPHAPVTAPSGRTRDHIEAMFTGWALVEPGVTALGQWRPDGEQPATDDLGNLVPLAGVAHKP
jgi:hypothetical protein